MPTGPEFTPPAPRQVEPTTALRLLGSATSLQDFFAAWSRRGGVLIEDDPGRGVAVLTVAREAGSPTERTVLLLDTLTHMHRQNLAPFLLEVREAHGGRVHLSAFELPRELRTGLALLVEDPWDPEVGRSRSRWKASFARTEAVTHRLEVFRSREGGESNLLSLPGAIPHPYTDGPGPSVPRGSLAEDSWHSSVFDAGIRSWFYSPHPAYGEPTATLIACDGDRLTTEVPLMPSLDRAHAGLRLDPTSVVFFAPLDPEDRSRVLGMNPVLPTFLEDELLPWAERHGTVARRPERRAMVGASLGGLATADVVRRAPGVVRNGIVQSGSFWWPMDDPAEPEGLQLRLWQDAPRYQLSARIFHEVGTLEGHLLADNRRFAEILCARGVDHVSREYVGGHDFACWRGGVVDGLLHFFGAGATASHRPAP